MQLDRQERTVMELPWDGTRERRVLDGALRSRRRRARRRFALELFVAMAVTFAAGRMLPRASVASGEARPALPVPSSELGPTPDGDATSPRSGAPAKPSRAKPLGGFAGNGGHGGTGSTGGGGSAGTG